MSPSLPMAARRHSSSCGAPCTLVWVLALVFAALPARAAGINHFEPAGGPQNYFVTSDPAVLGHFVPSAWSVMTYAHDPLVLKNKQGVEVSKVVEHQLTLEVGGSFGLFDFLEVGVSAPGMFLAGAGLEGGGLSVITLGDPRLLTKIKLTPWDEGFLAALRFDATLPLAQLNPAALGLTGDVFPVARLGGVVGYRGPWLRTALDVGVVLRAPDALGHQRVGPELTYGLAAEVPLWPDVLFATGDVFGRVAPEFLFSTSTQAPLEGALGVKAVFGAVQLTAGLGAGLWAGYGSPDARVFVGVGFVPPSAPTEPEPVRDAQKAADPNRDTDNDGIPDVSDGCADEPEDLDGFEDTDGCPDLDDDGDGVPDSEDRCRKEAEDKDGFEDDDGCPDLDADGDGVSDASDRCPAEPEDVDGFEDDDGCPDLDADGDGVLDPHDRCPDAAEDKDDWQDDDGCPEADNDEDGVGDEADECPNDPETKNGHEDEDGCPDSVEKDDLAVVVKRDTIEFNELVFFKRESSRIVPRAYPVLRRIAEVINAHTEIRAVLIEGHTDSTGPEEYNRRLSNWRALSVRKFLIRQGVSPNRLRVRALADTQPANSNSTAAGRAKNRRVELHILRAGEARLTPGSREDEIEAELPALVPLPEPKDAERKKERWKKRQQKKKARPGAAGSTSDKAPKGTP